MRYLKNKEMGGPLKPDFQDIPVIGKGVVNPDEHAKKRGRVVGGTNPPTKGYQRKQQQAKGREQRAALARRLGLKKG